MAAPDSELDDDDSELDDDLLADGRSNGKSKPARQKFLSPMEGDEER